MNILVIGEKFSTNLGDGIICQVVEELLISNMENINVETFDLSGKTSYPFQERKEITLSKSRFSSFKKNVSQKLTGIGIDTEYLKFKKFYLQKIKQGFREIVQDEFDVVVFAGGQLFKDSFIFPISDIVNYFDSKNVPVVFNACGIGEIKSKKMKQLLANTLSKKNVKHISTRDDITTLNTKFLVESVKKAILTYDPALWTAEAYNLKKKESQVVGLGIMLTNNQKFSDVVSFWKRTINDLNNNSIKWQMFCNGSEKDYLFADYLLDELSYSEVEKNELLADRPLKPEELVSLVATYKSLISFRLHSHITAYSLDIPTVGIIWDEKVKFFFNSIDCPNRCFQINDNVNIVELLNDVENMGYDKKKQYDQKEYLKEVLLKNIKEYSYSSNSKLN